MKAAKATDILADKRNKGHDERLRTEKFKKGWEKDSWLSLTPDEQESENKLVYQEEATQAASAE